MTLKLAIVGSGASGCYIAEAIAKLDSTAEIDVIERLATPFGLIRYGVAPDHQGTKAIVRTLDRILGHERVCFFGAVSVGRDIELAELRNLYDVIVLATGINRDRKLCIPGENLAGISGSGAFAGWYNDHVEAVRPALDLGRTRSVVVIGNGNVALDIARILAKTEPEFAGSDLSPAQTRTLAALPLESIHVIGRRGLAHAKFSLHELRELAGLANASVRVSPEDLANGPDIGDKTIRSFFETHCATSRNRNKPVEIRFHAGLDPFEFMGSDKVNAVRFKRKQWNGENYVPSGEIELSADFVVTSIGYDFFDRFDLGSSGGVLRNDDGKIQDGLYVVGWAKRGPSGVIGTNRADSQFVAQRILKEIRSSGRPGRAGLQVKLAERGIDWIDYAGWKRIEAAEGAAALPGRTRQKVANIAQQISIAQGVSL